MSERRVRSGALDLWVEELGDRSSPTIVLLAGAGAQGTSWEQGFCDLLVDAGRHVIRFDYRDTGQSDSVDFAAQPYTLTISLPM